MKNLLISFSLSILTLFALSCDQIEPDHSINIEGSYTVARLERNGTVVTFPANGTSVVLVVYRKSPNTVNILFQFFVNGIYQEADLTDDVTLERNSDASYSLTLDGQPAGSITGNQLILIMESPSLLGTWVANR